MPTPSTEPRFWNIWWTLTVLAAAFAVLVAILEYLGLVRELGIVLSLVSIVVTTLFGLIASTRTSVTRLGHALGEVQADVRTLHPLVETLARIERLLEARLPKLS